MNNTKRQADALIQSGFDSQRAGDLARAQSAYEAALDCHAEHPAALQLLGLLARRRGDAMQAESLMRRSLAADARQPHVWNNLGNLLDHGSRWPEALACFEQALALSATYADAHYNQARVLCTLGRHAEALAALLRAQALAPAPTSAMRQLHARILEGQGDLPSALAVLDEALRLSSDEHGLLHNRATLLQRLHRPAEALQAHERALELGLDVADAHYNHGNTLQAIGRLDDAVAAYQRALARQPLHRLALYDLARLRWRLGQPDFDRELVAAAMAHPQSPLAPSLRGNLLLRAERHADAAACFEQALAFCPPGAELHDGLARALARLGRLDESLAQHARAVAMAPEQTALRTNHAATLLTARRADAAAVQAEAACVLAPEDQQAWALLGQAWRELGDPREAWLNDYQRFVAVVDLPAPAPYPDMAAFCAALGAELAALHVDREAPVDQTLRHGTQTVGDIFEQAHPLVDALKGVVAQAVQAYVYSLPADATHPFLSRRAAAWRFTDSWSSRLRRSGFHTPHVHPHGWISSVCYVAVPAATQDTTRREGWLHLGQPEFGKGPSAEPRRMVQPRVGRLVLFPSMFWHGTTPFDDAEARLTIAFDVVPA